MGKAAVDAAAGLKAEPPRPISARPGAPGLRASAAT